MMTLEGNYRSPGYYEAKKNTRNRVTECVQKLRHGNQRRITSGQTIAADTFRPKLLGFLRKIYETEAPSSKMGKCDLVYKSAGSYARKIGLYRLAWPQDRNSV